MIEYLKKAFWAGPSLPGLGRLPVNFLAVLGFGILGFGHPGFWLMGAGLEAAYLATLVTHPRFQRLVDAEGRSRMTEAAQAGRQELVRSLEPPLRKRLAALEEKRARILDLARESGAGDFELESTRDALDRLLWIYLKLLVARHQLESTQAQANAAELKRKIEDLERDLAAGGGRTALRDSQAATLRLLRQRQENLEHCGENQRQVESDLARIEAQVDLAAESAALHGGGALVTANLEMASQALDEGLDFGESEAAVQALDQAYSAPVRGRGRERR
ncbi:MAG TPA: hypothetical protein VF173_23575 [Thermoanaerobaculia bacterium]|nr:hypothetical protein [Thermoanaerobaculia bacterium]